MKNNKLTALILAAILALSLTACNSKPAASGGSLPEGTVNAAQAESHLYKVMKAGKVRVGIIPDNPGWSTMGADGKWSGYDVTIAEELAKALGVELEIVSCEGNQRIPLVQSDNVDIVISGTGATTERAKSVTFSHPYAGSGAIGLAKKGNVPQSWEELEKYKIAVPRGTTQDIFITEKYPNADIVRFDAISDAFVALQTGKADVMLEQISAVHELESKNPDMEAMPVDPINAVYVGMVMQQGDSIWHDFVNQFIDNNLYSGHWGMLYKEQFGFDLPKMVTY